ncbi:Insulin Insulin B chain Insulin A chain Precursor [Larimichthys crocea]|uniref:Insulin n=1 Tax=Larimichthys crocea TaxID=215358 RepID=A0A6G0I8W3_LARCR|nr:Insulin Insulin B chain Insulin A chain Precursor [Larimichthys crocea]
MLPSRREFSAILLVAVCIPPGCNNNDRDKALSELYSSISDQQTAHPEGLLIVAGDFNHAYLKTGFPHVYQYTGPDQRSKSPDRSRSRYGCGQRVPPQHSTDWDMFKQAATYNRQINIQEYSDTLTAYISKYIDYVIDTKTITLSSSMAALWLQSFSLLVLLIISWPGSQAAIAPQQICGSDLVDALMLVCGPRGFSFTTKKNVDPVLGSLPPKAGGAEVASGRSVKRNIVEQCCHRACNLFDVESYCN